LYISRYYYLEIIYDEGNTMLYTKSAEYAIQALIYLAENNTDQPTMVSEIAETYEIPKQFLSKIAQTLVKFRLLDAIRGHNGGVKLARSAKDIYIHEIAYAIDGVPPEHERCVIGINECSDLAPCPFHGKWKVIRENIREMLMSENLHTLAKRVIEKRNEMAQANQ